MSLYKIFFVILQALTPESTMLLRVIIKNFLSFKDIVQFDMFPNAKRTSNWEHVYQYLDVSVLKQAAIYGSNGAGKSNLIKSLSFIKDFVLNKDFLDKTEIDKYFYSLLPEPEDEPIEIAIEFIAKNNQAYIYKIAISKSGIEDESLYISHLGKAKNDWVYKRVLNQVKFSFKTPRDIKDLVNRLIERNPRSSFLALNHEFPAIIDHHISESFSWFNDSLVVIGTNSTIPTLIDMMRCNGSLRSFTQEMLRNLCLGISGLDIETEEADEWISKHASEIPEKALDSLKEDEVIARMENERQALTIFSEEGVKKIGRFVFNQFGPNGYVGKMDIAAQSDGTVRLLTLLPAIYDAIKNGKTIVIDEINYKMHPSLILGLVEYFSKNKETNGQLIFTTHETSLMEEKQLLRNDEIWFVDKKNGMSMLYSLNDFKLHHSLSVRNGYLDGRFGAKPCIEDLITIMHGY